MQDAQLITQLLSRLDTNQMAVQAALDEVSLWIRQRGSEDTADNINGCLETLSANAEFIARGIAELTVSTGLSGWSRD